ncbi:hypothetical protein PHPALM_30371 [Phytophthora palmivora]|uniref:Uncharacterized protein n=1 Tax=Phytophthora palmivora TaxID=4796 RepID=A0A2P4X5D7_9STRA|nr:hypothetical protein PHPALM_30371 [Phytophthora palmivora]
MHNVSEPNRQYIFDNLHKIVHITLVSLEYSRYMFIGRRGHAYVLQLGAIRFLPCHRAYHLKAAKNNRFGREEKRFHYNYMDKLFCHVRAARWVFKATATLGSRKEDPEPKRGIIKSNDVSIVIKNAAARLGYDPARFSTHFVRVGGARDLLSSGPEVSTEARKTAKYCGGNRHDTPTSLPVPVDCWKSMALDFVFGLTANDKGNTGILCLCDV